MPRSVNQGFRQDILLVECLTVLKDSLPYTRQKQKIMRIPLQVHDIMTVSEFFKLFPSESKMPNIALLDDQECYC